LLKLSFGLAAALSVAIPVMADIDTQPSTINSNTSDSGRQKHSQMGLSFLLGADSFTTGTNDSGALTDYFPQTSGYWNRPGYDARDFGSVHSGRASYADALFVDGGNRFGNLQSQYESGYSAGGADSGTIGGANPADYQSSPVNPNVNLVQNPGLTFARTRTYTTEINNSGEVIGAYQDGSTFAGGAFLLSNGVFTGLPSTPWINNSGQIGQGSNGRNGGGVIPGGGYLPQGQWPGGPGGNNGGGAFAGTVNGPTGLGSTAPEPFAGLPLAAGLAAIAARHLWKRRRTA
jgi:hypothetical protein